MIHTYLLLAYRNLLANKTPSVINIVGLSIAVACSIAVFLILKNFWTLDNFHVNGDRIYMVEYTQKNDTDIQTFGDAPAPIAAALSTDFPQVKHTVRTEREGVTVFHKESVINEVLTYADTSFFQVFTFPLQYGNPAALTDPNAIILSSEAAEKYFPKQLSIGQPFTILTSSRERKQFIIQGVAEPFPNNAGLRFDLLVGYHPVHHILKNQDWSTHISGVFVEVQDNTNVTALTKRLNQYVAQYNSRNQDKPIESFVLDNLRHPAPKAYDVIRRPTEANHPLTTVIFSAIALVMMGLSCINYVNISLGGITRRLKEIGVRKVLGGTRRQLIVQFMIENLMLCAIALAVGLFFTVFFLIPLFNSIMVLDIALTFSQNTPLWLFLASLLLFTALASGAYPAFYISAFRPIAVLAGKQRFGGKGVFSRLLLVAQFALAFLAVIIGVVITSTGMQWKKLDWGYNPDQTLVLRLTDSTQYAILKNELAHNPSVSLIAGAENHIGESMVRSEVQIGDKLQPVVRFNVGASYGEALGLTRVAGQFFNPDRAAENAQLVVVNETFARSYTDGNSVNKTVRVDGKLFTITGVVRDMKLMGSGAERPAMFFFANEPSFQYLLARFEPGSGPTVVSHLERIWKANFPTTTISHYYQKNSFDAFNTAFQNLANGFGYLSGLALLIACMGLYGLASQHFTKRVKEVSVRKVLGATVGQIIVLVNKQFVVLMLLAGIIANGIGYLGIELTLQNTQDFTGSFRPGLWPFLLANLVVLATAAVAVSVQSWRIAHVQLSKELKDNG